MSNREIAEGKGTDAFPKKAKGGKSHGGGHAPDLSIAALADGQLQPAVGNLLPDPDGRHSWPAHR